MADIERLKERIKQAEGLRLKPYKCTSGKTSIGWGRNLDDNGISKEEAELLLNNDLDWAVAECEQWVWYQGHDDIRQNVIVEMCFNMGIPALRGFKRMIAALIEKDYNKAADEMLDSRWANQVGNRAKDLSEIMRNGE